jgi:hypothetical protein
MTKSNRRSLGRTVHPALHWKSQTMGGRRHGCPCPPRWAARNRCPNPPRLVAKLHQDRRRMVFRSVHLHGPAQKCHTRPSSTTRSQHVNQNNSTAHTHHKQSSSAAATKNSTAATTHVTQNDRSAHTLQHTHSPRRRFRFPPCHRFPHCYCRRTEGRFLLDGPAQQQQPQKTASSR